MRTRARLTAALLILVAASLACRRGGPTVVPQPSAPVPPAPEAEFHAGLRIAHAEFVTPAGRTENLTMAVWYPTRDAERLFTYELEQSYISHVAFEAAAAETAEPFPLVLYAHGAFSSGYSLAFFGEHLARHGYVVVAPDYIDTVPPDFTRPMAFSRIEGGAADPILRVFAAAREWVEVMNADPDLFLAYLAEHRLGQTRYVIDQALVWNADPASPFYQRIDPDRIGIVGWSLGCSTALALTGAHPDPSARDERLRADLLLSPPAYPFQDTLDRTAVPIMAMEGDDDPPNAGPDFPRRMIYDLAPPPRFNLVVKDTTHYDFGNRPAGDQPLDQAIEDVPGLNAIASYGLAFFDAYLKGDVSALGRLDSHHPGIVSYEAQP